MRKILKNGWALVASAILVSCLGDTESEYEKIVKRDDQLLADHIMDNDIDAEETQSGIYYTKDVALEEGDEIQSNSILGIYYEIRTLQGVLIESYWEEKGEPIIFKYGSELGLLPEAVNLMAGIANIGEELTLYVPSYRAYMTYSYNQLIPKDANLVIRVKYDRKYSESEIEEKEDLMIQDYMATHELEGFEKVEKGIYVRVVEEGDTETEVSKNGNLLDISFELSQLGENPFGEADEDQPARISLGSSNSFEFLNIGLKNLHQEAMVEVIAPSRSAYGETIQIIPFEIREDYYEKNGANMAARPYEPIMFKAKVLKIQ